MARDHNSRAVLAYFTAYAARGRRRVSLRNLMIRDRSPQTPERMLAIAKQWTETLGGKIQKAGETEAMNGHR